MAAHTSVLLDAAVDALVWDKQGVYVDGTFGRGGHAGAILERLASPGRLIGIDRDPQAVAQGETLAAQQSNFAMHAGAFSGVADILKRDSVHGNVAGLLLDLGVSSPQLDAAERGFSFSADGPLDMRMDPGSGQSAAQWLASAPADEIAEVLKTYGEERFARRIAAAIVSEREQQALSSTAQLAEVIKVAHPRWEPNRHPATKSFQAIRIYINDELGELQRILAQALDFLKVSGRLVIISFHSLEDRIVKRFLRGPIDAVPRHVPLRDSDMPAQRIRMLGKAMRPNAAEIDANPRARSAIMRVAELVA